MEAEVLKECQERVERMVETLRKLNAAFQSECQHRQRYLKEILEEALKEKGK
jgi:hypothetical protein